MARALVLTGGFTKDHDFTTTESIVGVLDGAGIACDVEPDVQAGLTRLSHDRFELVVANILLWTMGAKAYEPYREEFAFSPSPQVRAGLEAHLGRGGGLVAMHTSVISFDDWPEWSDVLGARWVWGRSGHPAPQGVEVDVAGGAHPVAVEPGTFHVVDELYNGLDLADDVEVLGWGRIDNLQAPVVWVRCQGEARICTDLLGHDRRSYDVPAHAALIAAAACWAARV